LYINTFSTSSNNDSINNSLFFFDPYSTPAGLKFPRGNSNNSNHGNNLGNNLNHPNSNSNNLSNHPRAVAVSSPSCVYNIVTVLLPAWAYNNARILGNFRSDWMINYAEKFSHEEEEQQQAQMERNTKRRRGSGGVDGN